MLDWVGLISNVLWIIALALALAALSYASWRAAISSQKLRSWLLKPIYQVVFSLTGVLFCTGLALGNLGTIQMFLWALLGILFLVQAALIFESDNRRTDK